MTIRLSAAAISSVLQRGLAITTAVFPARATLAAAIEPVAAGQTPAAAGDRSVSEVMRRLTDYMSGARDRALPADVVERLTTALQPEYVVLGGGNAKKVGKKLPPHVRIGNNDTAFEGGNQLWRASAGRR